MRTKLWWVLALALSGCQTWGPTWSELSGARWNRAVMDRRPAIIERVDDQGAFAQYPIKIEPGQHRLVLQGPDPRRPGGGTLQVFMLDAEPCQRYYINAQYKNNIEPEWTPVIDYVEAISGCTVAPKK
ncbi:MAG: hypothetical protein ABI886_15120 [Betaproteobacteria bacterium]